MNPRLVVVLSKVNEFPFKIQSIPEEDLVKVFTANGSDESLNEGMRSRCIALAPPGPRSLAIVVNKCVRSTSRSFMVEQGTKRICCALTH